MSAVIAPGRLEKGSDMRVKAFDTIDHRCLCEALERMGLDEGLIEALGDGYNKSTFFVEDEFGKSEKNNNIQVSDRDARCRHICLY